MTRLAAVKIERDTARAQLSITEICAQLALTTPADCLHTIADDTIPGARYVIHAYGLTRANGGYVTQTFQCPGQADFVRFYALDDWSAGIPTWYIEWQTVAMHIRSTRNHVIEQHYAKQTA